MYSLFNRILIAADLSTMDQTLFEFTKTLLQKSSASKLYILHVIPNFLNPSNPDLNFHQLFAKNYPVDEKANDLLKEKAEAYFDKNNIEIEINVVEGKPYEKLLNWIELKEIDLVVVGKKKQTEGSGITAKRMVRKTKASVLFVPESANSNFQSVLVPVDYSVQSAKALRAGLGLKEHSPNDLKVKALYVSSIPPVDSYYGMSLSQSHVDKLLGNSRDYFGQFIQNEKLDESLFAKEVIASKFSNVGRDIQMFAKKEGSDLIVIGAKGHSPFDRFVYGSVTEQLVDLLMETPTLVMR